MKNIVLILLMVLFVFANDVDMKWYDVKPSEALKMKKFGYNKTTKTLVVIMEEDTLVYKNVHREKARNLRKASNKDQEYYKIRPLLEKK